MSIHTENSIKLFTGPYRLPLPLDRQRALQSDLEQHELREIRQNRAFQRELDRLNSEHNLGLSPQAAFPILQELGSLPVIKIKDHNGNIWGIEVEDPDLISIHERYMTRCFGRRERSGPSPTLSQFTQTLRRSDSVRDVIPHPDPSTARETLQQRDELEDLRARVREIERERTSLDGALGTSPRDTFPVRTPPSRSRTRTRELAEARERVSDLQAEREELRRNIRNLRDEHDALSSANPADEDAIPRARRRASDTATGDFPPAADIPRAASPTHRSALDPRVADLTQRVEEEQARSGRLEHELGLLRIQLDAEREQVRTLTPYVERYRAEQQIATDLREEIRALQEAQLIDRRRIAQLQGELDTANRRIGELQPYVDRLRDAQGEIARLRHQINEVQTNRDLWFRTAHNFAQQSRDLRAERDASIDLLRRESTDHADTLANLEDVRGRFAVVETERARLIAEITRLNEVAEGTSRRDALIEAELERLRDDLNEKDRERSEMIDFMTKLSFKIAAADQALELERGHTSVARDELAGLQSSVTEGEEERDRLDNEIQTLERRLDENGRALETEQGESERLRGLYAEASTDLVANLEDTETLRSQMAELDKRASASDLAFRSERDAHAATQSRSVKLEVDLYKTTAALLTAEIDRENLRSRLQILQETLDSARDELARTEEEMEYLTARLRAAETEAAGSRRALAETTDARTLLSQNLRTALSERDENGHLLTEEQESHIATRGEVEELRTALAKNKRSCRRLRGEVADLTKSLQAAERARDEHSGELERLRKQHQQLDAAHKALIQKSKADNDASDRALEQERGRTHIAQTELRAALAQNKEATADLNATITSLTSKASTAEGTLAELRKRLTELEAANSALRDASTASAKELEVEKGHTREARDKEAQLENALKHNEEVRAELGRTIDTLTLKANTAEDTVTKNAATLAALRKQLAEVEAAAEAARTANAQALEQERGRTRIAQTELRAALAQNKEATADLNATITSLTSKASTAEGTLAELRKRLTELEAANSALRDASTASAKELEVEKGHTREARDKEAQLENALKHNEEVRAELGRTIDTLTLKANTAEDTVTKNAATLAALRKQLAEVEAAAEAARAESAQALELERGRTRTARDEAVRLQKALDENETARNSLSKQIDQLNALGIAAGRTVDDHAATIAGLTRNLELLEADHSTLRRKAAAERDASVLALKEERANVLRASERATSAEAVRGDLESNIAEFDKKLKELRRVNAELTGRVAYLEANLKAAQEESATDKEALITARTEHTSLRKQLSAAQKELADLERRLRSQAESLSEARTRELDHIATIHRQETDLSKLRLELTTQASQIKLLSGQLEELEALRGEVATLKSEARTLRYERESAQENVRDLLGAVGEDVVESFAGPAPSEGSARVVRGAAAITALKAKAAALQSQLQAQEKEAIELRIALEREESQHKLQAFEKEAELSRLRKELADLAPLLSDYEGSVETLPGTPYALNSRIKDLLRRIELLKKELAEKETAHKHERSRLSSAYDSQKAELAHLRDQNSKMYAELTDKTTASSKMSVRVLELEAEIQVQQLRLARTDSSVNEAIRVREHLENENARMLAYIKEQDQRLARLTGLESTHLEVLGREKEQIDRLQSQAMEIARLRELTRDQEASLAELRLTRPQISERTLTVHSSLPPSKRPGLSPPTGASAPSAVATGSSSISRRSSGSEDEGFDGLMRALADFNALQREFAGLVGSDELGKVKIEGLSESQKGTLICNRDLLNILSLATPMGSHGIEVGYDPAYTPVEFPRQFRVGRRDEETALEAHVKASVPSTGGTFHRDEETRRLLGIMRLTPYYKELGHLQSILKTKGMECSESNKTPFHNWPRQFASLMKFLGRYNRALRTKLVEFQRTKSSGALDDRAKLLALVKKLHVDAFFEAGGGHIGTQMRALVYMMEQLELFDLESSRRHKIDEGQREITHGEKQAAERETWEKQQSLHKEPKPFKPTIFEPKPYVSIFTRTPGLAHLRLDVQNVFNILKRICNSIDLD